MNLEVDDETELNDDIIEMIDEGRQQPLYIENDEELDTQLNAIHDGISNGITNHQDMSIRTLKFFISFLSFLR